MKTISRKEIETIIPELDLIPLIENGFAQYSAGNGMMLIFDQQTGELLSIMLDEGVLTWVRTAVAGAIAAKYLSPKSVRQIGIVGAGNQAKPIEKKQNYRDR